MAITATPWKPMQTPCMTLCPLPYCGPAPPQYSPPGDWMPGVVWELWYGSSSEDVRVRYGSCVGVVGVVWVAYLMVLSISIQSSSNHNFNCCLFSDGAPASHHVCLFEGYFMAILGCQLLIVGECSIYPMYPTTSHSNATDPPLHPTGSGCGWVSPSHTEIIQRWR